MTETKVDDNIMNTDDIEAVLIQTTSTNVRVPTHTDMNAVDLYISQMQGKSIKVADGAHVDVPDIPIEIPRKRDSPRNPVPVVPKSFNPVSGWTEIKSTSNRIAEYDDVDVDLQQTLSNIDGKVDVTYGCIQDVKSDVNEIYEEMTSIKDTVDDVQKKIAQINENVIKMGNFIGRAHIIVESTLAEAHRSLDSLTTSQRLLERMLSVLLKESNINYVDSNNISAATPAPAHTASENK